MIFEKKNDARPALIDYTTPLDYAALMNTLGVFSERYPFIGITHVGTSVLGRGIPMVTLGEGKRSTLYVGTHHGMEWLTGVLLLRFINEYCEALAAGRRMFGIGTEHLFRTRTIYVIPVFNVDGAEIQIHGAGDCILRDRLTGMNGGEDFSRWQANARGVDLNHNYDAGFYEYKKLEAQAGIVGGAPTRFSGEAPESEPETAALCSFIRYQRSICSVMSLHTQGGEIYWSSGDVTCPRSASIARVMSSLTGYGLSRPEGGAAYGGLTDWVLREIRIPSFTVECGRGENPLPLSDWYGVYSSVRELFFTFPILA